MRESGGERPLANAANPPQSDSVKTGFSNVLSRVRYGIQPDHREHHEAGDLVAALVIVIVRGRVDEPARVTMQVEFKLGEKSLIVIEQNAVQFVIVRIAETPVATGLDPPKNGGELRQIESR